MTFYDVRTYTCWHTTPSKRLGTNCLTLCTTRAVHTRGDLLQINATPLFSKDAAFEEAPKEPGFDSWMSSNRFLSFSQKCSVSSPWDNGPLSVLMSIGFSVSNWCIYRTYISPLPRFQKDLCFFQWFSMHRMVFKPVPTSHMRFIFLEWIFKISPPRFKFDKPGEKAGARVSTGTPYFFIYIYIYRYGISIHAYNYNYCAHTCVCMLYTHYI